jgi:hypothetical protein
MIRSASVRFVEKNFDSGLPQRVLWSNFRRLGFCISSDFSSLRIGDEDYADYFANVLVPSGQIPTASEHFGGFSLRHTDIVECFSAFKSITSNAVGVFVKFFKLLLPLIMCCIFSIMQSPLLFFLLCGSWLLSGWLLRLIYLIVFWASAPIGIVSVLSKAIEGN